MGVLRNRKEKKVLQELGEMAVQRINDRLMERENDQDKMETAREEGWQTGYHEGSRYTMLCCYAAAAQVIRRTAGQDKTVELLAEIDLLATGMVVNPGKPQEALDTAGIEVRLDEESERIRLKERRPVLCRSCLLGDGVASGAWDCDAIDGLTAGKTECEHYRRIE